ncbi:MAG: DUF6798 domain-containing protein [Bryobacteraceae bacterium]
MPLRLPAAAAILLIAVLTFYYPGHTWLHSDTQIYAPIMDRQLDGTLFRNELITQHPHVSFTLYDEITWVIRKVTGVDLYWALKLQQAVVRTAQAAGFYLLAAALGMNPVAAVVTAAALSLGGTILGPSVLTIEYEPVPRGFAVGLLVLGMGLVAHRRHRAAGLALAGSLMYHPPTLAPVLLILLLWAWFHRRNALWPVVVPVAVMTLIVLAAAKLQSTESPGFFSLLPVDAEELQRKRASYNWVSIWWRTWWSQHAGLWVLGLLAVGRLWRGLDPFWRWLLVGLPTVGILTMPLSYGLLEGLKWGLIPQFQPMRALLFVTLMPLLAACVAGTRAASAGRVVEAFAWFVPVYWIPANVRLWQVPTGDRLVLIAALAAFSAWSLWMLAKRHWVALAVLAALLPFYAIPRIAGGRQWSKLITPELTQLAEWANHTTPKDAVFVFPTARQDLAPGIFRAGSKRALYVDWKGGGQVNYFVSLGREWWRRYQDVMVKPDPSRPLSWYAERKIDFIVLGAAERRADGQTAYENPKYLVYPTHP